MFTCRRSPCAVDTGQALPLLPLTSLARTTLEGYYSPNRLITKYVLPEYSKPPPSLW